MAPYEKITKPMPSMLQQILETSLYVDDLNSAEQFYQEVLGLPKIFSVPGRQLVFRLNGSVLLIFNPQHTENESISINNGLIPRHGARGSVHLAFRASPAELDGWRTRLKSIGIPIESEITWPNGARSLYFRDPAGNSLELVTPDIWNPGGLVSP